MICGCYASLLLIDDENLMLTMANTFAACLWGSPEQYAVEYVDYAIPDRYEPTPYAVTPGQTDPHALVLSTQEHNYENENLLLEATRVIAVASTVSNREPSGRIRSL